MKRSKVMQRGSVSAVLACWGALFVTLAGLVLDGGRYVSAYGRTSDVAAAAARVGAQHLVGIREGHIRIDCQSAIRAAHAYLTSNGIDGVVRCTESMMTVEVKNSVEMSMLSLIGVDSRELSVKRHAVPVVQ